MLNPDERSHEVTAATDDVLGAYRARTSSVLRYCRNDGLPWVDTACAAASAADSSRRLRYTRKVTDCALSIVDTWLAGLAHDGCEPAIGDRSAARAGAPVVATTTAASPRTVSTVLARICIDTPPCSVGMS